jgi:ribose-phosphate pyrophosphokinase
MNRAVLNLSKTFKIIKDDFFKIEYETLTFYGGEEHIKLKKIPLVADNVLIVSSMSSSSEVMTTFLATNALKNLFPEAKLELLMPYIPYARQDRIMVQGEPESIKVFANILNSFNFNKVFVLDPHSNVSTALINNVHVLNNNIFVGNSFENIKSIHKDEINDIILVSPDAGAEKKIYDVAKNLDIENIVFGSKYRDVKTGKIIKTTFVGDVKDKICVINDDIIDGGATFVELANILKNAGAKKVYLIVTHGIFSKGIDGLKVLDGVFTTNSIRNFTEYSPFVKTIDLNDLYTFGS